MQLGCGRQAAAWSSLAVRGCSYLGLQFFLLAVTAYANGPVGAPWHRQVEHAPWIERDAHGVETLGDGSILVMAGWDGDFCVNDVWRSTAESAGQNWTLMTADAAFSARKFFSTVKLTDGSVLLMGGYDGHYQYFNDVWRTTMQSVGATWTVQTMGAGWSKRSGFAAVALPDDSLLVLGGCCYHHDVWRSEPGRMGSRWTLQTLNADWKERADLKAVTVVNQSSPNKENVVIILGGTSGIGTRNSLYMNDVWVSNANGTNWVEQTPAAGWSGRAAPAVVVLLDGSIIVLSGTKMVGRTYTMDGDVWRSPPDSLGARWELQTAVTGWHPRIGVATLLTAGPYTGRILMAGGFVHNPETTKFGRANDVWRTELPCQILTAPLNGVFGTCPAAPNVLESRMKCSPSCSLGYTSHSPFACSDGLLTSTTCDPNPCDASAAPQNGGVGNCTSVLPSHSWCLPTCNRGYTVSGFSSCILGNLTAATCLPNPCDTAPAPEHGSMGTCPPQLASSGSCQPMCNAGYTVSGPTTCYLGDLSRSICEPNPCRDAHLPPLNGARGDCPEVLQSGEDCQPTCNEGYLVSGVTACFLGNISRAKCLPKPCNVTLPSHGMRGDCPDVLESGSMCTPVCENRYDLVGVTSCLLGRFTASLCVPWPCNVTAPEHGSHGNCPDVLKSGEVCQPVCQQGYTVNGEFECMLGQLSDVSCLPNPCKNASKAPLHGTAGDCKAVLPSGATCQPTCNNGYTASGPTRCHLGNITRTVCNLTSCRENMAPLHGANGDCVGFLLSGSSCQPTCMDGYTVSRRSSCLRGNMTHATCEPNPCYNASQAPDYGNSGGCPLMLRSGQSCEPVCDPGYSLSRVTSCKLGQLDLAVCEPLRCNETAVPRHGSIGDCPDILTHGVVCQPECVPGYTVSGPAECAFGNLTKPICIGDVCNASIPPEHGSLGRCTDVLPFGETCAPECDDGYYVSGLTTCFHGLIDRATCLPNPCNITDGLMPHQQGPGNCPGTMQSGHSCLPECQDGFMLSNPLFCYLGSLGIATQAGTLRDRPAALSCHPAHMPLCIPKPCLLSEGVRGRHASAVGASSKPMLGMPCPAVLASGTTCSIDCQPGYTTTWASKCFCGTFTEAECVRDDDDPWWTITTSTSTASTSTASTSTAQLTTTLQLTMAPTTTSQTKISTSNRSTSPTSTLPPITNFSNATQVTTMTTVTMVTTVSTADSVLTPVLIKGTLTMTMPNAAAFLSDTASEEAVKNGLAAAHSVDSSQVEQVAMSSMRRLQGRGLLEGDRGSVQVTYSIFVPADSTQAAVKVLAYALTNAQLAAFIQIQLAPGRGSSYIITVTTQESPLVVVTSSRTTTSVTKTTATTTLAAATPAVSCPPVEEYEKYWDILFFCLGGLGAGMIASLIFCIFVLCARRCRKKPLEKDHLKEVVSTTAPDMDLDKQLWRNLQQQLEDTEQRLLNQRSLCDDLHDQLQSTFKRLDQTSLERDNKQDWGQGLQKQLQAKDEQIAKFRLDILQLEGALSSLQKLRASENEQYALMVANWQKLLQEEQERQKPPEPPKAAPRIADLAPIPGIKVLSKTGDLSPTGSDIVYQGVPWDAPEVAVAPPTPPAFARVRHLLEGSFVQVLPGMQLSDAGKVLCRPGDIGMIENLKSEMANLSTSVCLGDPEVCMTVLWMRTQLSSVVARKSWTWFRFIRTPEPRVGDFLQALPGADFADASGMQHYSVGDVGEVRSISTSQGPRAFRVVWPRTGKTSEIPQATWTWFRVFRVPSNGSAEAHDVSAHIDDLIAEGSEDTCFSVLWIRAGLAVQEPKVGDTLQVLPGVSFADPQGVNSYNAGDVGKITCVDAAVGRPGIASATVLWKHTGRESTIGDLHESMSSFRFFRMQEPRKGDLLVAAPGAEYIDVNGVEHYTAGDSGSVVNISPATPTGSGERIMSVCWARTGEMTDCSLTSWTTRFSLIPLQSNIPSYIRYPLVGIEDRV